MWFSTLNVKSGWWQGKVPEAHNRKKATVLWKSHYESQEMPFVICSIATTSERLLQNTLIMGFQKHDIAHFGDILP